MVRKIIPCAAPLDAVLQLPGSKSLTNRALICAALAGGDSTVHNASDSDDTALMMNGLNQLGILVRRSGHNLSVEGKGGRVYGPRFPVPVGNAGTTFRFLFALAALADRPVTFEASGRMAERPIGPLVDALGQLGVRTETAAFAGRYSVHGGGLHGGEVTISGDESSQFVSSLLMVAPYAAESVRITVAGDPVSLPYRGMTLQVMREFGVPVEERSGLLTVPLRPYLPTGYHVEGDASAAAVFLAAGLIAGGTLRLSGLPDSSLQGDVRMFELMAESGAGIERVGTDSVLFHGGGTGSFRGIDVDLRETPDLVPPLACAMLFADSPSRLRNTPHLRLKESDRLEVLCREIGKLGGDVRVVEDGLTITPRPLHGAELDPEDDHRLAMSLALTGLRLQGVSVRKPECVKKSFPRFWEQFELIEGRGR